VSADLPGCLVTLTYYFIQCYNAMLFCVTMFEYAIDEYSTHSYVGHESKPSTYSKTTSWAYLVPILPKWA